MFTFLKKNKNLLLWVSLSFFVFLIFILIFPPISRTQPDVPSFFPSRKNLTAEISAKVAVKLNSNKFRYSYSVTNSMDSQQGLDLWVIEHPPGLEITIFATPTEWISKQSSDPPLVGWAGFDPVSPGSSQGGFEVEALSLPGILNSSYQGFVPVEELPYFPEGAPEEISGGSVFENSVKVKIMGPTPIPTTFNPIEFLNILISLKGEAYSLGWIDNSGIKTSLDAKLNAAKRALEMGDITRTKNILQVFLDEVEAQNEKHLTSEAYGLLKYNVLYLLDNL